MSTTHKNAPSLHNALPIESPRCYAQITVGPTPQCVLHVNSAQKCNGPASLRPCGIGFSLCSNESPRCYAQITAGPTPQCVLHVNSTQKCNAPAKLRPCAIV